MKADPRKYCQKCGHTWSATDEQCQGCGFDPVNDDVASQEYGDACSEYLREKAKRPQENGR